MRVLSINCTLKRSPQPSHTDALLDKLDALFEAEGAACERIRLVDHDVKYGVVPDAGSGDAWPGIFSRVQAADILIVGTPIWMGHRASTAQLLMERLDGSSTTTNELGQYPLYNKAVGVVVTGNEDGAHACAESTLYNLTHFGATAPANCDSYWVGDAGKGNSYRDAQAQYSRYVNRTARLLVKNTLHIARLLQRDPYPTDVAAIEETVKDVSDHEYEITYRTPP